MTDPINLPELRERCTEEAPVSEQMTILDKTKLLALITAVEAARELDESATRYEDTTEVGTSEYMNLRDALARFTTD